MRKGFTPLRGTASLFVRSERNGVEAMVNVAPSAWMMRAASGADRLCSQAPEVAEAAVCVPDRDGADAVAFFLVARDLDAAGAAPRAGANALPPRQRPRWLHAIDTPPRTPTGKILRRKLQELHRTLT